MADAFSVDLNEYWQRYITAKVAGGAFPSAEELVTSALCLLEEQERKIEHVSALIEEGEQSGDAGPWDLQGFLDEMHQHTDNREAA